MTTILLSSFLLLSGPDAMAGSLAGVSMPDTATVAGKTVKLQGMGLREKYFIDVYVGGLYLATPTSDASQAISADEPKRIVMHFVYKDVPKDKMVESFVEGFASVPGGSSHSAALDTLGGWMVDLTNGDEVVLDYAPGAGTTVSVKGSQKGTIAGTDFMKALWGVYLGKAPPTPKLKRGMLGS